VSSHIPRVLICEASAPYAAGLQRLLEYDGDIMVAASLRTPTEAMATLPSVHPDVVAVDIEGTVMAGLAAIEEIMSADPIPILVLSAHAGAGDKDAAATLAAGALDVIAKETLDLNDPAGSAATAFRNRVRLLSHSPVIRHPRARLRKASADRRLRRLVSSIGVCGSTGGPYVLARLLGGLPADYPIPILVVQHISAGFTKGLAQWLDQTVPVPVGIAEDGALLSPGAWIAPEGAHLRLAFTGRLSLDRRVTGVHRPSGDVLFESMAAVAKERAVSVVLSGIGSDGTKGTATIRGNGGLAIAQDRRSSVVFGMPQAAIASGVDLVLTPDEMVTYLTELRYRPLTGRC
jgi:two-component system chemotaxis response regulator CheB